MKHNIVTPSVGESITEVSILKWAKENGQQVKAGEVLLEIESDKASVEIVAENNGKLTILTPAGERLPIGEVIGFIDDALTGSAEAPAAPRSATTTATSPTAPSAGPAARKAMAEKGLSPDQLQGSGPQGRITKGDVLQAAPPQRVNAHLPTPPASAAPLASRPGDRRVPMSTLRARIAERLVQAQHTAAILTTFNEADMSGVMQLRSQHKDAFKAKHGVALGFMSFFTRACVEAFKLVPETNAQIDGRDVIYHDYVDMGVAVGSDRGLVVPIVRDAHKMGFVEIETKINELALKAREGKLSIADMSGGTFTISNGGVYGSLLSTPILNMPQSAILGMHKIQERPIAVNGRVEIRPMMYLALSYDHRLIDGKGAVTFLVTLKEFLESPEKLGLTY